MIDTSLLAIARGVAVEAAERVAEARRGIIEVADVKSSSVDVVTQVDRDTESFIRRRLLELRPDDAFFGEESGGGGGTSGLTWVVDPIDGTVNFLYGIPFYAVSIAVVEGEPDPQSWRALAGAVINPASGELFTGAAGEGAFLGDAALRVSQPDSLEKALLATGFSYDAGIRGEQGAVVAQLLSRVRDIRRMGSAALDLCDVAAGRVDAYFERTLNPWDHAAGGLIAEEAGARVSGLGVPRPSTAFLLAAHPEVSALLEPLLLEVAAGGPQAD